jgi:mono/diheme cytochrome c family protein
MLWPVVLCALLLAGCGATHAQPVRSKPKTVGVNLNAPSTPTGPIVVNNTPHGAAVAPPPSLHGAARETFRQGEEVAGKAGCLGCHVIGAEGNNGPGPELTHIGARLSRLEITRAIVHATAPMPSFSGLSKPKLHALTAFLTDLR